MVWSCLNVLSFSKDNPTGHSKKEIQADRRRGGETISKIGQGWTLPAQLGQMRSEQCKKGLLKIHLWCPTTFHDRPLGLSWFNWWVSFAPGFQCCYFCESSCLFYLSFNFDFYVSKIMHL